MATPRQKMPLAMGNADVGSPVLPSMNVPRARPTAPTISGMSTPPAHDDEESPCSWGRKLKRP